MAVDGECHAHAFISAPHISRINVSSAPPIYIGVSLNEINAFDPDLALVRPTSTEIAGAPRRLLRRDWRRRTASGFYRSARAIFRKCPRLKRHRPARVRSASRVAIATSDAATRNRDRARDKPAFPPPQASARRFCLVPGFVEVSAGDEPRKGRRSIQGPRKRLMAIVDLAA